MVQYLPFVMKLLENINVPVFQAWSFLYFNNPFCFLNESVFLSLNPVWIFTLKDTLFKFNYLYSKHSLRSRDLWQRKKFDPDFWSANLLCQTLEIMKWKNVSYFGVVFFFLEITFFFIIKNWSISRFFRDNIFKSKCLSKKWVVVSADSVNRQNRLQQSYLVWLLNL